MIKKIRLLMVLCLFAITTPLLSSVLSSDMFNQSVNAGSEEALGIRYQRQPSYQLVAGDKPAKETGWESHSTLTTGLFPLRTGERSYLSYMVKADNRYKQLPVLWTEIRYFDRHGVNVAITNGNKQGIVADWCKNVIHLAPNKADIAYAEVWFVKYQSGLRDDNEREEDDKDSGDDKYHTATIYLSDIKLK